MFRQLLKRGWQNYKPMGVGNDGKVQYLRGTNGRKSRQSSSGLYQREDSSPTCEVLQIKEGTSCGMMKRGTAMSGSTYQQHRTTERRQFAAVEFSRDLSTQALLVDVAEVDATVNALSIALGDGDGYNWDRGVSERSIYNTAKKIIDTAAELKAMGLVVEHDLGCGTSIVYLRRRGEKTDYITRIVYPLNKQMSHLRCRKICDELLEAVRD